MTTQLSKIKQPAPNVSQANPSEEKSKKKGKFKIIPARNIGIVKVPKLSTTPISDMLEIKKKENPRIKYSLADDNKKYSLNNIHTFVGLSVIGCAIVSIIKLFKK